MGDHPNGALADAAVASASAQKSQILHTPIAVPVTLDNHRPLHLSRRHVSPRIPAGSISDAGMYTTDLPLSPRARPLNCSWQQRRS